MTFEHLEWLYAAAPILAVLVVLRFWRRHFWGHSLVQQLGPELGKPNPALRSPRTLEAMAIVFLLIALLGPVYPFSLTRIERGGLQIMFVLDLSQSMEEPIQGPGGQPTGAQAKTGAAPAAAPAMTISGSMLAAPGSKMEAVKKSGLEFVNKRPGDAIGLVVFSNNAYLVSPATFDHESMSQYLLMTGTHTLVNEGYTAIGEGLGAANLFFEQQRQKTNRRAKGQVIVLLTDGDNNAGRDPMTEIERARTDGTRIYMIGVALQEGAAQEIAATVPQTGGKFYDVRRSDQLQQALTDINDVEKGVFYTLSIVRNQPAYFVFVLLSLACLATRLILHAIPQLVEIS